MEYLIATYALRFAAIAQMHNLPAHSFMALALDGNQFHHPVAIEQVMFVKGLLFQGDYYGFIVVEPSTDPRYRFWPVLVDQ